MESTLSVKQLSAEVGLSQSRLRYLFVTNCGITIREYKKLSKLQRLIDARMQLVTTTSPLKVIRSDAGYTNDSHFIRDFKLVDELSPAKRRKAAKTPLRS